MTVAIPITVLTGFLGSGKTTVLRHLGSLGVLQRTLILVNEFGEVGLDHELLTPIDDDTLVAVESGCICCTIRADLVQTLSEAPWRYARDGQRWFDRVIIETTGIADPAPILQTILGDEKVSNQYALAAVLTAVDAVNGAQTLKHHFEAVKQVAVADRILLTKADLLDGSNEALMRSIRTLAPSAPINPIVDGEASADWFFSNNIYSAEGKTSDVEAWLMDESQQASADVEGYNHNHDYNHYHAHDLDLNRHGTIAASCLTFEQPVDAALFETCLAMLMEFRGEDLLRVKGIINVAGMDRPMVIHGVQHVFHPPEILDGWPSADRRSKIVIIARELEIDAIRSCFASVGLEALGN
ncbi:MAG: GTP-binding protein [Pseudomonadota bacterium]|nr:GTP-binding protein [Pseudomonadota bacterium]